MRERLPQVSLDQTVLGSIDISSVDNALKVIKKDIRRKQQKRDRRNVKQEEEVAVQNAKYAYRQVFYLYMFLESLLKGSAE